MLIATVVSVITAMAGTGDAALPIVVPVAGAVYSRMLTRDLYKGAQVYMFALMTSTWMTVFRPFPRQDVVRRLMAYIVDLTCIMQIIFLLTVVRPSMEVTPDVVRMAMKAYEETCRHDVHSDINDFGVHLAIAPGKRDTVLEKIKELIAKCRVSDEQVSELRRQLP